MDKYDLCVFKNEHESGCSVKKHPTGAFYKVSDVDTVIAELEADYRTQLEAKENLVERIAELEAKLDAEKRVSGNLRIDMRNAGKVISQQQDAMEDAGISRTAWEEQE